MRAALFIFILLIFHTTISAQSDSTTIDDYYVDFNVPDLSAFSMLGIENDEIVRPGNLKEFAAGISNFVDTDGSLKPALGLEWTFMKSFTKNNPGQWNKRFQPRNLALSFATTQQDSLGLRLGIGFKWVPIDKGDPMGDNNFYKSISILSTGYFETDFYKKKKEFNEKMYKNLGFNRQSMSSDQDKVYEAIFTELNTNGEALKDYCKKINEGEIENLDSVLISKISTLIENSNLFAQYENKITELVNLYNGLILQQCSGSNITYSEFISEIIKERKEKYKKDHWNAFAIEISGGWVGHSITANYEDLRQEKLSFFTGFSQPTFNKGKKIKGQLIGQFKYNINLSNDSIDFNEFSIGLRHLIGNSDNRLSAEVYYSNAERNFNLIQMTETVSYLQYSIGTELKITEGSWLEFAFGGQAFFEGGNEDNRILANFGFKHAIMNKRRYNN